MNILGIDYGRKKIGLAISNGKLAEPMKVIRYTDIKKLSEQIRQIIKQEKIEKVIVGVSEGEMAIESKKFATLITSYQPQSGKLRLSPVTVEFSDETLSSYDAVDMSIQAGMSRKKRKEMEDAFAASIMLQSYIDHV
ncbi:MAG: Holliday junction resolvase RuvX [Patescibacteria group bacterium]